MTGGEQPGAPGEARSQESSWSWQFWTRIAGTSLAFLFLLSSADLLRDTWQRLRDIDLGTWLLAASVHMISLAMGVERLATLIRSSGHERPRSQLMVDLLQSTALNAVLVMGSGELLRVKRVLRSVGSVALAAGLVVADRSIGVAALAMTGGVAWLCFAPQNTLPHSVWHWAAYAALGAAATLLFLRLENRMNGRITAAWSALRSMRGGLLRVSAVSLIGVSSWIFSLDLIASSLGIEVPLVAMAYAAPMVAIATILPISVGGIGVREAGYALLLGGWGVDAGASISLGLAQYAVFLAIAALGAASMAITPDSPSPS